MKTLVLGGTAWLGRHLAQRALERGHDVTCVARGSDIPDGARLVTADRDDDDALSGVASEHWDAVVDVARQPGHVRRAVRDLRDSADRYAFVSTTSVYASQAELDADETGAVLEPLEADTYDGAELYGSAKVACEDAVRAGFDDRSLIVRPGLIGGPGDPTRRTDHWPWRFAHPAADGAVLVPDAPELPASIIDVRDLADWLVHGIEAGVSGTFNALGPVVPFPEHLEAARRAAVRIVGGASRPVLAPETWLTDHGVGQWAGPGALPLWIADPDWYGMNARSNARARAAGLRLRPLEETLADALSAREAASGGDSAAGSTAGSSVGLSDRDEHRLLEELTAAQ
ncbi:NAD-dependent epimerase/dehydratase family protein [Frigoribacterium sp. 2-23]|uniref:NAD-dependent epimerase/dehydratase family protein n=1 Tax=Frigoribacterium sp. 2-23 TaxID=3415006 RepID=UPI003C6F5EDC